MALRSGLVRRHTLLAHKGVAAISIGTLLNTSAATAQRVDFDHRSCAARSAGVCTAAKKIVAKNNDVITVVIRNTQPELFDYSVAGIKPPPPSSRTEGGPKPEFSDLALTIAHDKQYAGYVITAKRKAGKSPGLPDAVFTIRVETSEWKAAFAGGFAFSSLRDKALTLEAVEKSDPQSYTIEEDKDNRDNGRRTVATFVHAWYSRAPWAAISFGLGLDNGSGQDYLYGLTWRLGDQAALTLGGVFGSVKGTPSGKPIGSTVTDANALSSRVNKTATGLFLGLSYSFLGGGSADLAKPFKGATGSAPAEGAANSVASREGNTSSGTGSGAKMSAESPAPETSVVVDQPIQLVAKVVDGTNAPLDQVTVYWWLTSGKASLSADTTETDTNGAATITVKVPTAGGELPATVVASLDPKGSPGPRKTEFKLAKP